MDQRGENGGFVRIEALMAVARLSIDDAEFLNGLRGDLERTLWRYGFALSPQELEDTRGYFSSRADDRNNEITRAFERDLAELSGRSSPEERSRYWRL